MQGFAIYGQTPLTLNTWDIYWLAVDGCFQKRGVGRDLLRKTEEDMLGGETAVIPVVRVETSSRDDYAPARALYLKSGYVETGRISDFYKPGDSLVTFAKHLSR